MSETAHQQVSLHCNPVKEDHALVFPYEFINYGPGTVLVSDAYHGYDSATHRVYADHDTLVIAHQPNGNALVLRGVPPPPSFPAVRPVFPLVRRLEPGARLEGTMRVPLPLAEANPYRPYSNIRDYTQTSIVGIIVGLDWIAEGTPELVATPAEGTDGLLKIYAPSLGQIMTRATCTLPTRGLSLLVRKS